MEKLKAYQTPSRYWLKPVDGLVLAFQFLLIAVALTGDPAADRAALVGVNLLFSSALLLFLWWTRGAWNPLLRFLRDWYPLLIMASLYEEVGLLVHAYFDWTLDPLLIRADRLLFGGGPALWAWQEASSPPRWLNEFFHIGYGFYFLLMPLATGVLWARADRPTFETFLFTLTLTYYGHYTVFMLLPAHSPRLFLEGLSWPLPGYAFSNLLEETVRGHAYAGGSFPSSHVAAAVVCWMAWPYLKFLRWPVLFGILTMFAATVWARYHYGVDLLAGLATGWFFLRLGPAVERVWPLPAAPEGGHRGRFFSAPLGS